jgi:crotonobetainyl-CoA:carnitine CoA-transferase CaiB-like acyl-CoA transferase
MMTASDLNGITVVTIEQAVAAPYASGKLADAGARVIKIERPEGDFGRGYDKDAKGRVPILSGLIGAKNRLLSI